MNTKPHVAIVGATGAVGVEMIKTLEKRKFPVGQLTLLASARSAGKKLPFRGQPITVRELTAESFQGIDIALFSAGGSISKEFAPKAVKAGCVVIDNSSAFRMDDSVPLVVPEINAGDIALHNGIIANPIAPPPSRSWRSSLCTRPSVSKGFSPPVTRPFPAPAPRPSRNCRRQVAPNRGGRTGDEGSLSAPNRLQRPAASGCVSARRLHQGRGQDGKRRPQNHASSELSAPA